MLKDIENKQLAPKNDDDIDDYIYSCTDNVASTTECTGLIPAPPVSESEAESYTDLYSIPKPAKGSAQQTLHEKPDTD